jgi:hypothetical protein
MLESFQSWFMDEAQIIMQRLQAKFFLSADGQYKRSAYSAFVKGMVNISSPILMHYPCFSGTGLSLEPLRKETTNSVMAKPFAHTYAFTRLKTLKVEDVKEYMNTFLDLSEVGKDLVEHVAKWLCGRPRWTGTFLETFLVRKAKLDDTTPRGNSIRFLVQYPAESTKSGG